MIEPKRGEIWMIDFEPSLGCEITKIRPAVVISSDILGKLPLKLVAPVTGWKDSYKNHPWHVRINKNKDNGLTKDSSVDAFQIRSVDMGILRFKSLVGRITASQMSEVSIAIAAVIEYE